MDHCNCPNSEWLSTTDTCPCCNAPGKVKEPVREQFDAEYFEALEALLKALEQEEELRQSYPDQF